MTSRPARFSMQVSVINIYVAVALAPDLLPKPNDEINSRWARPDSNRILFSDPFLLSDLFIFQKCQISIKSSDVGETDTKVTGAAITLNIGTMTCRAC
jgi:hypothetical protein